MPKIAQQHQDERLYTKIAQQQVVFLRSTTKMLDLVDNLREEYGRKARKLREKIIEHNIERCCNARLQDCRWENVILKLWLLTQRTLKARRDFKNTGIPPSDWTLTDVVDDDDDK